MTAREGRSATLFEGCAPRPSLSSYTTRWDTTEGCQIRCANLCEAIPLLHVTIGFEGEDFSQGAGIRTNGIATTEAVRQDMHLSPARPDLHQNRFLALCGRLASRL